MSAIRKGPAYQDAAVRYFRRGCKMI